jgi:hypothetical protein
MLGIEYAKGHQQEGRWICKTETGRNSGTGRREICKVMMVLRPGVERSELFWLLRLLVAWKAADML